jgi:hypothetical protein
VALNVCSFEYDFSVFGCLTDVSYWGFFSHLLRKQPIRFEYGP